MFEDPLEIMDGHDRFLLHIAHEVDKLIHENPSNLANFRRQVGVFVNKCEGYLGGTSPGKPNTLTPPPYLLGPVLPKECREQLASPQDIQNLLPDYYFLLTLIHDNLLSPPQFVPINNGIYKNQEDWVTCCWKHYGSYLAGGEIKTLIERAFEHVYADLAGKDVLGNWADARVINEAESD